MREQAAQDHRIGNIRHLKFVEAEKAGFIRDLARHGRNGVGLATRTRRMNTLMGFDHEGVEMDAAFSRHRRFGEEQIHQHGFAAADIAPEIKPARAGDFGREQREPAPPGIRLQRAGECVQPFRSRLLRGIGFQCPVSDQRAIALQQRHQSLRGRSAQ